MGGVYLESWLEPRNFEYFAGIGLMFGSLEVISGRVQNSADGSNYVIKKSPIVKGRGMVEEASLMFGW